MFQIYLYSIEDDGMTCIDVLNSATVSGSLYIYDSEQFIGKPITILEAHLCSDKLAIIIKIAEQMFAVCFVVNIGTVNLSL